MNGARVLIRTLVERGVDVCFTNPGTSEMHFVAALDDVPDMRAILCLFEGVATGAADGYARMTGRPAATLLHLGPGLGNGLANLHNARRASSPIVNIVGDHATWHAPLDSPLTSDIESVARSVSPGFVRHVSRADDIAGDVRAAVAAASSAPGSIATLVVPADALWGVGATPAAAAPAVVQHTVPSDHVERVAQVLRESERPVILAGGRACLDPALSRLAVVAADTEARLLCETFPARLRRGAGLPAPERLAYLSELAVKQLDGTTDLVFVDAAAPVSFFAYPGLRSELVPDGCRVHDLASGDRDVAAAVEHLVDALGIGATTVARTMSPKRPELPTGPLTARGVMAGVGALMPEGAIISDESVTAGTFAFHETRGAPPHDYLSLTGGSIGQGLPVALGAAVAFPDRKVIALEADGSAMYTLQALWTMAREELDVVVVVVNNRSYSVLKMELERVGARSDGARANALIDLDRPNLDFVSLATGMGVPAVSVATGEAFVDALRAGLAATGPMLIEAVVPPLA